MSHATANAKRLFTRAANTKGRKRVRLRRLAKQWASRALETDAQREAREEREHQHHTANQEAKRIVHIERLAADEDRKERARRWAYREALRFVDETAAQRVERIKTEIQRRQDHKAARAALFSKRKKKGSILDRERQEVRAAKQREREAKQEAKRAADRKPAAALPPLPYAALPAPAPLPPLPYPALPPLPY